MAKLVKAVAKNNTTVYYKDEPYGVTVVAHKIVKGQALEREIVSTHKISDRTISRILGDRNVILKDGDKFISTFSNDFDYISS